MQVEECLQQFGEPDVIRKKIGNENITERQLWQRNPPMVSTERWAETFLIEFCILGILEDFCHNQCQMTEQIKFWFKINKLNTEILNCVNEWSRLGGSSPPE